MRISVDTAYKFLGDSISGIATKNTTTNLDYCLPEDYILYGAELLIKDAAWGDYVVFQVVDKDNILGYGENIVLNEWVKRWYVDPETSKWMVQSQVGSTIPTGLYIRLKYTSVNLLLDTKVSLNLYMIKQSA